MKSFCLFKISFLFLFLCFHLNVGTAQNKVELTTRNHQIVGQDLYFDIYMNTSVKDEVIRLSHADLIIAYAPTAFLNPSIEKVMEEGASEAVNPQLQNYFEHKTTASILEDKVVINILGATPTDEDSFHKQVPQLGFSEEGHFLGRFKLSGLVNPLETKLLTWACEEKRKTIILSFDPHTYQSNPITVSCNDRHVNELPNDLNMEHMTSLMQLVPNPAKDKAQVLLDVTEIQACQLNIYNQLGQKVFIANHMLYQGYNAIPIDLQEYSKGMYVVEIQTTTGTQSKKLVIR